VDVLTLSRPTPYPVSTYSVHEASLADACARMSLITTPPPLRRPDFKDPPRLPRDDEAVRSAIRQQLSNRGGPGVLSGAYRGRGGDRWRWLKASDACYSLGRCLKLARWATPDGGRGSWRAPWWPSTAGAEGDCDCLLHNDIERGRIFPRRELTESWWKEIVPQVWPVRSCINLRTGRREGRSKRSCKPHAWLLHIPAMTVL